MLAYPIVLRSEVAVAVKQEEEEAGGCSGTKPNRIFPSSTIEILEILDRPAEGMRE